MTNARYELMQGDVIDVLRTLPRESVHCCVTSPPYWGLRDYGVAGQLGCEKRLDCLGWATGEKCGECHICKMVAVFAEVSRVLRKDGTLWLNYGDCYATQPAGNKLARSPFGGGDIKADKPFSTIVEGLKPKDLCMVPARIALALQADGWYLRSEIVWAKRAPMPESVTDRPTSAHEKIFLLSKSATYFYDADAVREKSEANKESLQRYQYGKSDGQKYLSPTDGSKTDFCSGKGKEWSSDRNLRNVWSLGTEPYAKAHFATFPTIIPKRAILAGTSEKGCCPCCGAGWVRVVEKPFRGDGNPYTYEERATVGNKMRLGGREFAKQHAKTPNKETGWQPFCQCGEEETISATVLDPFAGSGTTLAVALELGRRAIGIELNPEYIEMAHERISPYAAQELLRFDEVMQELEQEVKPTQVRQTNIFDFLDSPKYMG